MSHLSTHMIVKLKASVRVNNGCVFMDVGVCDCVSVWRVCEQYMYSADPNMRQITRQKQSWQREVNLRSMPNHNYFKFVLLYYYYSGLYFLIFTIINVIPPWPIQFLYCCILYSFPIRKERKSKIHFFLSLSGFQILLTASISRMTGVPHLTLPWDVHLMHLSL